MAFYLDTSALVKLVVAEDESQDLRSWLSESAALPVASDLARTELLRTVRRTAPDLMERARDVLDSVVLLQLSTDVFEEAARLDPPTLRSLDALHLGAALRLGDDLEGMVTYDDRLGHASLALGVRVIHPGKHTPSSA